jgi:Thioesterase superfamily
VVLISVPGTLCFVEDNCMLIWRLRIVVVQIVVNKMVNILDKGSDLPPDSVGESAGGETRHINDSQSCEGATSALSGLRRVIDLSEEKLSDGVRRITEGYGADIVIDAIGGEILSTLASDESFTTMTLSINFFRPVWQAGLRAETRVVNREKNVGYVECDVTDQNGKQIAKANSTCLILRGEHAKAR